MFKKVVFALWLSLMSAALVAAPTEPQIDVNTATAEQLADGLDGIGPAKAEAIVKDREAHGKFKSVEDLTRVKGIKKATLDKIRDKVIAK